MSRGFPTVILALSQNPDVTAIPRQKAPLDDIPDRSDLAGRLRFAMKRADVNANQMEVATGVTRQALYAVLQGKTKALSYPILRALSKQLGVRPEWLADGVMPMFPVPELRDDEEIQLIRDFRAMSHQHQRDLTKLAHSWAEDDDGKPAGSRPFLRSRPAKQ